ncbi:hypothetical protein CPC08DRAFT_706983 [Agrocybe pediades]|nr:hypothetical protein CPC08DRAFT_706983 [Agrocybe pediades]
MEQDERYNHEPTTAFQTAQDHAQALMYELSLINESSSVVYMRHVLSSAERFLDAHQEFPLQFIDLRLKLCTLESMLRLRELLLYRQKHFIDRVTEDWQRKFESQGQGRMEGQSSPTSTAPLETPTAEERYPAPPSHEEDMEKGRETAEIVPPLNGAPFSAPNVNASVPSNRVTASRQNLSFTNAQASAPPIPPPHPPFPLPHPTFTPHPSPPPSPNAHQIQIQLTNSNNNTNGPLSLSFRFHPTEDRGAITFDRPQTLVDTPPADDQTVQTRAGRSQPPPPLRLETMPIILPNSPVPFKVLPLPEVSESERETRDTPTSVAFKRPQVRAEAGFGSTRARSRLGVEIKCEVALGLQLQLEAGPEIVEGDEDTVLFGAERRARPHSHTPATSENAHHDPRAASKSHHSAFLLSPNEPGSLDRHHFIESRERGTWSAPKSVCLSGMAEEGEETEKQRQREEIECIKARIYQPRPGYVIPWGVFWRGMEKWEEKQNVAAAGQEQEQQAKQCQDDCDRDQQEQQHQQTDGNIAEVDETMHVDSMGTICRQISSRPFFDGTSFVPEPVTPHRTSSDRLQMFDFSLIATPPGYESDCEAFGGFSPAMRSRRGRGRRVELESRLLYPPNHPSSTETSLNAGFPISPRSSESVSPVSPLPRMPYAAHTRSLFLGLESGLSVGVNDSEEEEEETNREGNLGNGIKRHLLHTISEGEEEEEEHAASDSGAEADREEDGMDTDQDTAAFLGDSFYTSGGEVHDRSCNHDEDPEVGGFLGDSFYTSGGGDEDPEDPLVDEQQERGSSSQSGISDESVASPKADDSTRAAVTRTTTNGSSPSLNKTNHFKGRPLPPIPVACSSFSIAKP